MGTGKAVGKVFSAVGSLVKLGILLAVVAFFVLTNPTRETLIEGVGQDLGMGGELGKLTEAFASKFDSVSVERHNYWLFSTLGAKVGNDPERQVAVGVAGMVIGPKKMQRFRKNAEENAAELARVLDEQKKSLSRQAGELADTIGDKTAELGRQAGEWAVALGDRTAELGRQAGELKDRAKGALDRQLEALGMKMRKKDAAPKEEKKGDAEKRGGPADEEPADKARGLAAKLLEAAKSGGVEEIKSLLSAGADVNARDDNGGTALMWAAAENDDPGALEALLAAGADVNVRAEQGFTALMLAAVTDENTRSDRILGDIIQEAARRTNAVTGGGVEVTVTKGEYPKPRKLKALLDAGADVNARSDHGMTALMWAAAQNENPEVVKALAAAGADVDCRNLVGGTPLMAAAAVGSVDVVKALLAAGADVKSRSNVGETALLNGAAGGDPEVVRALLAAGADVNAQEEMFGATPLMAAVAADRPELVKMLLASGADAAAKDKNGKTALDHAEARGHAKVAELLRAAGTPSPQTADAGEEKEQPAKSAPASGKEDAVLEQTLQAFERGDLSIMFGLPGGDLDIKPENAEQIRRAAEQGNAFAQMHLGLLYMEGKGLPEDAEQAEYWIKRTIESLGRAAEQGNAWAQFFLGALLGFFPGEDNDVIAKDEKKAADLIGQAAEQGLIWAQLFMHKIYEDGELGVEEDEEQAALWLRKAAETARPEAERGNAVAQSALGEVYEEARDDEQAALWLGRAAKQGHEGARSLLNLWAESDLRNLVTNEYGLNSDMPPYFGRTGKGLRPGMGGTGAGELLEGPLKYASGDNPGSLLSGSDASGTPQSIGIDVRAGVFLRADTSADGQNFIAYSRHKQGDRAYARTDRSSDMFHCDNDAWAGRPGLQVKTVAEPPEDGDLTRIDCGGSPVSTWQRGR